MPNDDPAAGRAAYAKKRKKGKGRKVSKAERERMAAAEEEEEEAAAAAAAAAAASMQRARDGRSAGNKKKIVASAVDKEARAEAERARAPWEDAVEEMRRREKGWMHSREVRGKAVVVLVDDPRSNRPRVTWYSEEGCGSADVPAGFTAHEAIIMGKAGEEWFTVDDTRLGILDGCGDGRLRATLGCVGEDNARGAAAASGSAAAAASTSGGEEEAAAQEAKAARTVVFVYYSGPQTVDDRIEILRKIDDEVAAEDERKAEILRKAQDKRKAEAGGGCKAEDEREAGGGGSPLRGYVGDELKRLEVKRRLEGEEKGMEKKKEKKGRKK